MNHFGFYAKQNDVPGVIPGLLTILFLFIFHPPIQAAAIFRNSSETSIESLTSDGGKSDLILQDGNTLSRKELSQQRRAAKKELQQTARNLRKKGSDKKELNILALISFIFAVSSILSLIFILITNIFTPLFIFGLWLSAGFVGFVLSIITLKRINEDTQRGKRLAGAGLVICIVSLFALFWMGIF